MLLFLPHAQVLVLSKHGWNIRTKTNNLTCKWCWVLKRLQWPLYQHTTMGCYTGLFCLSGKCQGVIDISHWALYLCAMFQVLWSGFMLTFTSALLSLSLFLGLTENSSTGFQWGVFHLRQSSLPILASLFDVGYLFWDPTFQHVLWLRFTPDPLFTEVRKKTVLQQWLRIPSAAIIGR